jgi:hypothetical protein
MRKELKSAYLFVCLGCLGDFDYYPDKNVTSTKSGKFEVFNDGVIFGMRGHLHDGGESMVLYINDKRVCESKAVYGGPGAVRTGKDGRIWETISDMSECLKPVSVKRGDKLEIEANYDLDRHPV